ncbi:MAG: metal ABC transporter substrate-binding protein [Candidatus Margulisiibacteriota bacterium]
MVKSIFRIFIIVISTMMVIWWLNTPFLDSEKDTSPKIVVTTPLLEDLVVTLLGPEINVTSLIVPGQNPLQARLTSDSKTKISHADIIIMNGSQVDGEFQTLIQYTKKSARVINVSALFRKHKNISDFYWMDIVDWSHLVYLMQDRLRDLLPKRRSEINYRMSAYSKEVFDLYQKIRNELGGLDLNQMKIATNHPSFEPFATLFQLDVTIIDIPIDPKPEDVAQIVTQLKENNITVFIPNEYISAQGLDAVVKAANKSGLNLRIYSPIITLNLDGPGSGVETYLQLMTMNLRTLING